ncbi:WecB/TagA/CpsF family glycosyltransferase [Acaryochloris marina NIES-2412]|uniref:WecB/TagA/CpsF family glycosyltransferase n=1 Tax=Acaryochloris marina TaxID=155978 RepID=UPI00405A30CE
MQLESQPTKLDLTLKKGSVDHPIIEISLLERRITFMTTSRIVDVIDDACLRKNKIVVSNYNVHGFNLSMQLPWLYRFHQKADYVHCDGMGILKTANFLGLDLSDNYHTSYTSLMPKVLDLANQKGYSVFFLGSKPHILETALHNLRLNYSNASFFGHHGYFLSDDPAENALNQQKVLASINEVKPNILVMGMGMPLQEQWVDKNKEHLNVNAIMLGGAIIDRLAGEVPDCPQLLTKMGLEWIFRLVREPKRLMGRYVIGNPTFLMNIALASALGIQPLIIHQKKQ